MKLTLEPELFVNANRHDLMKILYNALDNYAYLDFDIDNPDIRSWVHANNIDDWQLAHDSLIMDEASYHITNSVIVRAELTTSDWTQEVPVISLGDAKIIMTQQLCIWVENARNDGDFFRLFLSPESRELIEHLEELGRLKFDTIGGIGEMRKEITQSPTRLGYRNKQFVVYDSDASEPNKLQRDAVAIKTACEQHKIKHHYWRRRAIENYLPVPYLLEKIHPNNLGNSDAQKYRAFCSMTDVQKHHFHMKKGINDSTCYNSPLYQERETEKILSTENLYEGFSSSFANKFISQINSKEAFVIRRFMAMDDKMGELKQLEKSLIHYIRVPI
ncbi:TPA: hypothetical protein I7676_19925 [Vibrio vulnificus]|nr:hypothetical protein [Vibrio vulnificus]HAS8137913.1 hypothetical protein [Vibrio vulnificus]HAS8218913.1 hypothetical protein [Vibrio vulnificus]HAS8299634.1 hypothetical protein [Vibrio vulnificus]